MNNEKIRGEIKRMENEVTRKKYTEEGIKRGGEKEWKRGRERERESICQKKIISIQ